MARPQAHALACYVVLIAVAAGLIAAWNRESLLPYRAAYNTQAAEALERLLPVTSDLRLRLFFDGMAPDRLLPIERAYRTTPGAKVDTAAGVTEAYAACGAGCEFDEVLHRRDAGMAGEIHVYFLRGPSLNPDVRGVTFGRYRAGWKFLPEGIQAAEIRSLIDELRNFLLSPAPAFGTDGEHIEGLGAREYHVSLALVNADPASGPVDWDGEGIRATVSAFLDTITKATAQGAQRMIEFRLDSQVLNHGVLPDEPQREVDGSAFALPAKAMQRLLLVNDWKLNAFSESRQTKALNFMVFIPAVQHCPFVLRRDDGEVVVEPAFAWPGWGGVAFVCPPSRSAAVALRLQRDDLRPALSSFIVQLRQLLGITWSLALPPEWRYSGGAGLCPLWEIDLWHRQLTINMATKAVHTIVQLHRLLDQLPGMPLTDHIAGTVTQAMAAAQQALHADYGPPVFQAAQEALLHAETAFFDQSLLGQLYFPDEHKLAVFAPFFLPLAFTILMGAAHLRKKPATAAVTLDKKSD